jgi:hypothetical protein
MLLVAIARTWNQEGLMRVSKGLVSGLVAPLAAVSMLSAVTAGSGAVPSAVSQWPWAQARPAATVTGGHGLPTVRTLADSTDPNSLDAWIPDW